jgi:hypothetical protein
VGIIGAKNVLKAVGTSKLSVGESVAIAKQIMTKSANVMNTQNGSASRLNTSFSFFIENTSDFCIGIS